MAGTLTAPAGGDVSNTIVVACYNNTETCGEVSDDGNSLADGYSNLTIVTQTGESSPYSVDNLQAVQFSLIAARDSNGDALLNAGDYLGVYTADGQSVTLVTLPQIGLTIQLIDVADLQGAANRDSITARALRAAESLIR